MFRKLFSNDVWQQWGDGKHYASVALPVLTVKHTAYYPPPPRHMKPYEFVYEYKEGRE